MTRLVPVLSLLALACTPVGGLYLTPEDSAVPEGDTDTDTDADGDTDADADADTDADADSDADTDPEYFRPDYIGAAGYLGVSGGEIVDWRYQGSETISYFYIMLAGVDYFHVGDESQLCMLYYVPDSTPVDPGSARLAWTMDWEPYYATDPCYQLDPDYYGASPLYDIGVSSGSVSVEAMSDYTEELLQHSWGDYFDENALGAEVHLGDLDGFFEIYWNHYPELQLYHGWAFTADEDMNSGFDQYMNPRELGGSQNAVLHLSSLYMEAPDAGMP